MSSLSQFIASKPANADIAALLNEDVEQEYNHDPWTYAGVANLFGPVAAEGIAQAMTAAGLTTAVMVYAAKGFDLSLDTTRSQLDAIAAGVPALASVCSALKRIGRPTIKRHTLVGIANMPTTAEINAAKAELVERQAINELAAKYDQAKQSAATLAMTASDNALQPSATLAEAKARLSVTAINDLITELNALKAAIQ